MKMKTILEKALKYIIFPDHSFLKDVEVSSARGFYFVDYLIDFDEVHNKLFNDEDVFKKIRNETYQIFKMVNITDGKILISFNEKTR